MASNPKMEYQVFLCIFQKNSAMASLGLKEMGKFPWEGREKGLPCWLSQFSKTKLRQPTGQKKIPYLTQRNFPISFQPKVAIAKFIGKMQKKSGIMKSGLDVGMARGIPRPSFLEVPDLFLPLDSSRNRFYHSSGPRGPRQTSSRTSKIGQLKNVLIFFKIT
jgi:hypothetical protein